MLWEMPGWRKAALKGGKHPRCRLKGQALILRFAETILKGGNTAEFCGGGGHCFRQSWGTRPGQGPRTVYNSCNDCRRLIEL